MPPVPPPNPWQPATAAEAPAPAAREPDPFHKRLFGPLVVLGLLLLKFGKFALIAVKAGPVLPMLISVGAYALIWGWKFGVGVVVLLFIHETGHWIQLKREGVQPEKMIFIPFLGAGVVAKKLDDAVAEARVALAGPIVGALGALACVPLYLATDQEFFKALAFFGFFLNLINLIPVPPLDGGNAAAAMSPRMWFVGLGVVLLAVFIIPNPILILIAIVAVFMTYKRWKTRHEGVAGNAAYYSEVKPSHRLAVGVVYIALIAALAIGMDLTFVDKDFRDI